MKMNRVWLISMIDESNNGLAAPRHVESWSRRDTIVTNKVGFPKARIDLLLKWLNFDLVIINWNARFGVCICSAGC